MLIDIYREYRKGRHMEGKCVLFWIDNAATCILAKRKVNLITSATRSKVGSTFMQWGSEVLQMYLNVCEHGRAFLIFLRLGTERVTNPPLSKTIHEAVRVILALEVCVNMCCNGRLSWRRGWGCVVAVAEWGLLWFASQVFPHNTSVLGVVVEKFDEHVVVMW